MKYIIEGSSLPVVVCELAAGEVLISESGGRTWARGDVITETTSGGGLGKSLGRVFSGESLFLSRYIAKSSAQIAFASCFPGSIIAKELEEGESVICQKSAFLAATEGVDISISFQKKLGAGLFGGEGFIMQKITGPGVVFLEIDGYASTVSLQPGERVVCDTGVVAIMDGSCRLDIETVKGIKNIMFGGEGLFNTVVTGPGSVVLQSMPISQFASKISPYVATGKTN
jgi:uncharacterized protein (TIGR00266 family)